MVFRHKGTKFGEERQKEIIKRYYILIFRCKKCDNNNRLRDLEIDFMGRFHCPDCNDTNFSIKKDRISKENVELRKPESAIVMIEHIRRLE